MEIRKINSTNFENEKHIKDCGLTYAVNLINGRWKLHILCRLENGKLRFSELRNSISVITERMLALQLRELEKDQLITRTIHPEIPPRVDYELTEMGRILVEIWKPLDSWGTMHKHMIEDKEAKSLI